MTELLHANLNYSLSTEAKALRQEKTLLQPVEVGSSQDGLI